MICEVCGRNLNAINQDNMANGRTYQVLCEDCYRKNRGGKRMAKKEFDNNGRISLWKRVRKSDGEEFLSGNVEINGTKYNITLNVNNSTNDRAPSYVGKMVEAE